MRKRAMIFRSALPGRRAPGPYGPLGRHPPVAADTESRHPVLAVKSKLRAASPPVSRGLALEAGAGPTSRGAWTEPDRPVGG
jgi:hypothetical protein